MSVNVSENIEDFRAREFIRSLVNLAKRSSHQNRVNFDMIRIDDNVMITAQDHYPSIELFAIYENPPEGYVEQKLVRRFEEPSRFGKYFIGKDKNKNVLVFERIDIDNLDEFTVHKSIKDITRFISAD